MIKLNLLAAVILINSSITFAYDYDDVQDIVDEFDADNSWDVITNLVNLEDYFSK